MTFFRSLSLVVALSVSFACDSDTKDQQGAKAKADEAIGCDTLLERTQAACRAALFDGVKDSGCLQGVMALETTARQRQGKGFQTDSDKLDDSKTLDAMCRGLLEKTMDERAAKGEKAKDEMGPECRKRAEEIDARCIETLTLDGAVPDCKVTLQAGLACPDRTR